MTKSNVSNSGEVWKPVVGYEGFYEVSDHGRVRGLARWREGKGGVMISVRGRVLKGGQSYGYRIVHLCKEGTVRVFGVHTLVMAAFVGPRPDGHQVNHVNFDRVDNKPENLEYLTPGDNSRHSVRNGRKGGVSGESHYLAILSDRQVSEVRELAHTMTHQEIADRFGVKYRYVSSLITGPNRRG